MNADSICCHPSTGLSLRKKSRRISGWRWSFVALLSVCLMGYVNSSRGEAMLELFQMSWSQITQKMPELAEAGYDSLWVPNPAKGNSGVYSSGYDQFDPFDLGSTNQQGTIPTFYGTQAQLVNMVQVAHRFGIRIYFDNIMNHRSSTVPGYLYSGTPTNYYPGLIPQDFHLATVAVGNNTYYTNWPSVSEWCDIENVQNQPLLGLCDLAQEPGNLNYNFGPVLGDTTNKPVFIREPGRPDLYMDTNGTPLGGGWYPFDGNGQPVPEDVTAYLCRAVAWTLYITKCDGFRLDAVKHVPVGFFGAESGEINDPTFAGYTGAIQAQYDYVHGYGSNVTHNGYIETDGNRNSCYNTEVTRNDAVLFGEYEPGAITSGDDFVDYINSGMRLENFPLNEQLNSIYYGTSMLGMDSPFYLPSGGNCDGSANFTGYNGINFTENQDGSSQYTVNFGMDNAYDFMHEGLPMVYSDGFNHNSSGGAPTWATPIVPTNSVDGFVNINNYLGEHGDNSTPDIMYLHNQLSRGYTWSRWSDQNTVLFERYDYREGNPAQPQTQDVVLCGYNDDTGYPGDITFDDGITRESDGYYLNPTNTTSTAVSNSRGVGLVVGFAPGSVLVQLCSSSPTGGRAYQKLLVHGATQSYSAATNSENATDPTARLIYVGTQTLATNGGAIELNLPSDAWVMYGYQWPQASQANPATNAIILVQGGVPAPSMTIYRTDGADGDTNYSPLFPFKMRGSVDTYTGAPIMAPGEGNVTNLTYAIDVPVVTNAPFNILVRNDASSVNTLVKLDGGMDLNSQMGLGATNSSLTNIVDLRDNPPGFADDVFLGYEQTAFDFRNGPEKFAARNILTNNIVSLGAETYYYTVGGTNLVIGGDTYGIGITNQTADWVYHDPNAPTTVISNSPPATQMVPTNPATGQSVDIWVKVGYQFEINTCFIYYTTDGSNPEGAFGMGKGTTQVAQGHFINHDSVTANIDWWMGTIPGQTNMTQVRYKVGLFSGGSYGFSIGNTNGWPSIQPISDAEVQGSKLFGLTEQSISNFNPATATVWLHNDLNAANTVTGLQTGFHILRARTFLPRSGQSSVYNTFLQTFYYAGPLPGGVFVYPAPGGAVTNANATCVIRVDSSVTGVNFNIQDSNPSNDDLVTGVANGNGNDTNGNPIFVPATQVSPEPALDPLYPNDLQEFQFSYANVPSGGPATITVQLKDYANTLYTNRYALLTNNVTTVAPSNIVEISSPAQDGTIVPLTGTNLIQVCWSLSLDPHGSRSLFTLSINGVTIPQNSYILEPPGAAAGCTGFAQLFYYWTMNSPGTTSGTNVIQIGYTNASTGVSLSDTRTVIVPPAPVLGSQGLGSQIVTWSSSPNLTYMVLATTNLTQPFEPISGYIPSQGSTTSFLDPDTNAEPQKFYEVIQTVQ
jgi:hypothetical protein